jgi:hypothetical protein
MADQTRNEWRLGVQDDDRGTLVVVSDEMTPVLQSLADRFATHRLQFDDEPGLVKLYLYDVPYASVAELRSQQFEFSWIPRRIIDIFTGACGGEDCEASRSCVRPGCLCKEDQRTHRWKCR